MGVKMGSGKYAPIPWSLHQSTAIEGMLAREFGHVLISSR
jgi:hypothetical protein